MSGRTTALRATLDGRVVDIKVSPTGAVTMQQDGEEVVLVVGALGQPSTDGSHLLSVARASGEGSQVTAAAIEDALWVFVDGDVFEIEVERADHVPTRRRARADGTLTAPMPATVMRILVEPGHVVAHGDTLLLLEAMKMELPVRAPRDGRVRAVHCKAGELVQPGVALVEFDSGEQEMTNNK